MSADRILVVEDDPRTADTIRLYLEHAGFEVETAADGKRGLALAGTGRHRLVILDRMLPGMDGDRLLKAIRRRSRVPVIMVTARSTEDDRVEGLELGADDYVAKPFSPRELVARVRTVLRRTGTGPEDEPLLRFRDLVLDPVRFEVRVRGEAVSLTPTEFELLRILASRPGRVFSRDELLERIRSDDFDGVDRTVDAHVMNLRKKIERDRARPEYVRTVFGRGYAFGVEAADA